MIRTLSLLALFVCVWPLQATTLSFGSISPSQLSNDVKAGEGYQCNQQPITWCIDEPTYYRESGYAELMESEKQLELTLLFEFSTHRLSELQLNLRKDGFGLDSVEIEGESFDVQAELEKAAMQGDKSKVDKQLIQFLNQYPQSAERSLVWSTQLWRATLLSDGELITLTLLGTLEQKDVR